MLLAGADDIEIVGEAADGSEVEHAVAEHQPDIVLMDIRMPGMDGLAATEIVRGRDRPPEVIVLTTFDADDHVLRALRAGASGFLLKDTPPAEHRPGNPSRRRRRADPLPHDHPPADRARDGKRRRRAPPPRPRTARPPHRTRTRGRRRDRTRQVQRRNQPRALHEHRHGESARLARSSRSSNSTTASRSPCSHTTPAKPSAVAVYVCPVFGGRLGFLRWLTRAYCRVWLAGCEYVRSAMTRAIA